jgi:putative heme-binding domain-containing protein
MAALNSSDPFVHTAAVVGLGLEDFYTSAELKQIETSRQRLGVLESAHWRDVQEPLRTKLLTTALRDADTNVQLYAVRWIAEEKLSVFRPTLNQLLGSNKASLPLFKATVAAIEWLDKGNTENARRADYLARVLDQPDEYDDSIVAGALRSIPSDHAGLTVEKLEQFANSTNARIQRAAVRCLALIEKPGRYELLGSIATDESRDGQIRADAIIGLVPDIERNRDLLTELKDSKIANVRHEVARALREGAVTAAIERPAVSDTNAWLDLLMAKGDSERGWRRFFGPGSGRCASCHVYQERGAAIGPDLTQIANRLDRRRLIESILQPSREVAPRYVATMVETDDGRVFTGLSLGADSNGKTEQFVDADGQRFVLDIDKIEHRSLSLQSIMPTDLHEVLSIDDLRDLVALLEQDGT